MKCSVLHVYGSWEIVLNACRNTIGKNQVEKEPSTTWKKKILLAEHSPIRLIQVHVKWEELPWYVHTHIVRHTIGTWQQDQLDFVQSSRIDLTGIGRDRSQNDLVNYEATFNLQAIINISRKRMCNKADVRTRAAWNLMLKSVFEYIPELKPFCVPDCVYRGLCPEIKKCGISFDTDRSEYLEYINESNTIC